MQPAVVLVHGAWHTPEHYQEVISALRRTGFEQVQCPRLPSQTSTLPLPPTANLEHDTLEIRHVVESLVNEGDFVIMLAHSYGGVVTNNALDGLLLPQRQMAQLPGGVVDLVYMAAFVNPAMTRMVDPFNGEVMPWVTEDVESGVIHMQNPRQAFYAHIESDAEAQSWLDKIVYCPTSVLKDMQTYAPYEHVGNGVDATYLVCERDKELKVPIQEAMSNLLGPSRRLEYCDAGHCCMIGYSETIANVVKQAWEVSKNRLGA